MPQSRSVSLDCSVHLEAFCEGGGLGGKVIVVTKFTVSLARDILSSETHTTIYRYCMVSPCTV